MVTSWSEKRLAALGALLCAIVLGGTLVAVHLVRAPQGVQVAVTVEEVGGSIRPGADVKQHGLVVGRVSAMSADAHGVRLTLDLDRDQVDRVSTGTRVRILPATVFGTTFVDLVPPTGDRLTSAAVTDGAVLAEDTSSHTLELQQALDSIDDLVTALGPARLSQVLHSAASALDGRGAQLGRTIDRADHLLATVEPSLPTLGEDLGLLADNLDTVQAVAPDLLDSLDDTAAVARDVVARRHQLGRLLDVSLRTLGAAEVLLDRIAVPLVQGMRLAAAVSDAVYDNREGVAAMPRSVRELLGRTFTVTDGGPLGIDARPVDPEQYDYYTPADCPRFGEATGSNCGGQR